MEISNNKFVSLSYDLNVGEGDERELMEKATTEAPLNFLFGMGMMLEVFEKNLVGLQQGDKFSFTLNPEDAYGDYADENVIELSKDIFLVDGKFDSEQIAEGHIVPMMDSNGNRLNGAILEVKDNAVVVDFNHPLAGETLHFNGEVLEVREPSAEEIAALTAGGCGCGSDCSSAEDEGCGCGCGSCH